MAPDRRDENSAGANAGRDFGAWSRQYRLSISKHEALLMTKGNLEQSSEGKQRLEILLSAEEIEHLADLAQQLGLTISELISRVVPFLEATLELKKERQRETDKTVEGPG